MATYFDLLPEDILLILLERSRVLKDVNDTFEKLFNEMVIKISKGLINPEDYFAPVINRGTGGMVGWNFYKVEGEDIDSHDFRIEGIIDKIVEYSVAYFYDGYFDYQGDVSFVCQAGIQFYYDIMNVMDKTIQPTTSKVFYLYFDASWNSAASNVNIYLNITWKNFWNMKLDQGTRDIILRRNDWI